MAITNEQSEPEVRTVGEKQPYDFSKKKNPKMQQFLHMLEIYENGFLIVFLFIFFLRKQPH